MSESGSAFESELRISPRLVIIVVVILAMAMYVVSDELPDLSQRFRLQLFAVSVWALSAIAWLLDRWTPAVGRWFVVIMLVAIVWSGNNWMGMPGIWALLAIPTGLAAALIGIPAATATAVGETVLLLLQPQTLAAGVDRAEVGVFVALIWATLVVMVAVYHPVHQVARWSSDYYERARGFLDEARDRRAELEQALEDLSHANRQLGMANERLAHLRFVAEEAEKAKAGFVAKVSHEFRTPLNMIIGLVGLMVENPEVYGQELPTAVSDDLEIVHRNCRHLSSMINDVLDLSQAEAGRLALRREWVDLAEMIRGARAVVQPLLEKKKLDLRVIAPDHLPEVYCDETRIWQVILNLVSNAARFTEEGGITIRVAQQAQRVVVSVTDTGPGILPEDAKRIFEPFCQGTGNLWRDTGGSGLGLSISKQFIERHGGRIWLESEQGIGSTFSFELPISAPVPHVARPGHWISEKWVWVERSGRPDSPNAPFRPRVVVCDETGGLYPAFKRCSDEVEFVDGRDLATTMQELRQSPAHAVVLNTTLPNGLWSLVERVRQMVPDTPLIGCCVPPRLERTLEAGAGDYLTKPVKRIDLEKAIQGTGEPVKRVLVVDDDADVLALWTRMLHACDSAPEVVTASTGAQALDALRARSPDLMLLDVVMPDMDGWQVLELKNQDETIRGIPVVLVSGQDPMQQPVASPALLATMGEGLSLSTLLRCSLELSALLLKHDGGRDQAPV